MGVSSPHVSTHFSSLNFLDKLRPQSPQINTDGRIKASIKVLMTNEKNWFGIIVEYIRYYIFGRVTPGSATDLQRSIQIVIKDVLAKADPKKIERSTDAFFLSFSKRVEVLKLDLDKGPVALKLIQAAFEKKSVDSTRMNALLERCAAYGSNNAEKASNPEEIKGKLSEVSHEPMTQLNKFWAHRSLKMLSGATLTGLSIWAGYHLLNMSSTNLAQNPEFTESLTQNITIITNIASSYLNCNSWSSLMPFLPACAISSLVMPAMLTERHLNHEHVADRTPIVMNETEDTVINETAETEVEKPTPLTEEQ